MAIDKDAWIFGLSVAIIAVLFGLVALTNQSSIFPYFFIIFTYGVPSGLGFFIGQRIHKQYLKLHHIFVAALSTYVLTDTLVRIIGISQENLYVLFIILFLLSGLIGWRAPKMFNKNGS